MYRERHTRYRLLSIALLALAWSGCAEDDPENPSFSPPPGGGNVTQGDASSVVTGDAGTGGPGAGGQPGGTTGGVGSTGGNLGGGAPGGTSGGTAGGTGGLDGGSPGTPDGGVAPGPDGGAAPDGGGGTTGGGMRPDQGMGDGKDVITIGDSWMNLGFDDTSMIGIQASLERASKRDYRNYGIGGTTLLDNNSIPAQYVKAKAAGAIKTVIMTGGGNDVLQDIELGPITALFGTPGCIDGTFNDACKKRNDEVAAKLKSMWAEMAKDGVQDVVMIAYTNKALGGQYKMTQAYSTQIIAPICNGVPAPLRCTTLDTDMTVPDLTLRDDGIHPDDASYDKIGAAVWAHMQRLGIRR